jgi:hypothetical protein
MTVSADGSFEATPPNLEKTSVLSTSHLEPLLLALKNAEQTDHEVTPKMSPDFIVALRAYASTSALEAAMETLPAALRDQTCAALAKVRAAIGVNAVALAALEDAITRAIRAGQLPAFLETMKQPQFVDRYAAAR